MIELKSLLSPLTSGIKFAYDKFRSSEKAYIKKAMKELNDSVKFQRDYLLSFIEAESDFNKNIYWNEEQVKQYLHFKLTTDSYFHFPNEDSDKLTNEIKGFFIISGNVLSEQDFTAVVKKIVVLAQDHFRNNSTIDAKLMNYITLRQPRPATNDEVRSYIQEMNKELSKKLDKLTPSYEKSLDGLKLDFNQHYKLCVNLYDNNKDTECLFEVERLRANSTLDNSQEQALKLLEIGIYYSQYNYEKAYILIKQLEEVLEERLLFYFLGIKGVVLSERGNNINSTTLIKQAIDCFEKQFELMTEETEGYAFTVLYNIGTSFLNLSESVENIQFAIECFQQAASINPGNAEVYKNLGSSYGVLGQVEKEVECYERALANNPDLFEAQCAMAWALLNYEHNIEESIHYYQKALTHKDRMNHFPTIYYWLSIGYLHNEGYEVALKNIDKGLDIEPDNTHLVRLKIDVLDTLIEDNPQKYIPVLHRLQREQQNTLGTDLYKSIAEIYIKAKQFTDCKNIIDKLLSEQKENDIADLLLMYAFSIFDNQKGSVELQTTKAYFEKINPDNIVNPRMNWIYHFLQSQLFMEEQDFDKAIASYQEILAIKNKALEDCNVFSFIGEAYAKKEDFENSRKYFLKARNSALEPSLEIEKGIFEACYHLERKNCAYTSFYKMLDIIELLSASMLFQKENKISDQFEGALSVVIDSKLKLAILKATLEVKSLTDENAAEKVGKLFASYGEDFSKDLIKKIIPYPSKKYKVIENFILQKITEVEQERL